VPDNPALPLDMKISPERPAVLAPRLRSFKARVILNSLGAPLPATFVIDCLSRGSSHQLSQRDIGFPFPPAYRHVRRFSGTGKGVIPLAGNSKSDHGKKVF
jgi:hypothetical protein